MGKIKFDPQKYRPIPNNGHPDLNPDSVAYEEYWAKETDRCLHGFKPKGMKKISGKYYFYLNYYMILGNDGTSGNRKTLIHPWYRTMDHEYFDTIELCKEEGKGMIVIKARDKGFSYMNSGAVAHEYTFFPFNDVGVAAGLQATADAFFDKTRKGLNGIHPNFKHSVLKDTDGIMRSGYKQKNKDGKWEIGGYQSTIICRTMDNPEVFKGERVSLMVFEEAGEFKKLKNAYMSSKACFMDGDIQFGVPIVGGTGGDISKASKDFMDMYYSHDAYNLIPVFIPASKAYYGFFDIQSGEEDEKGAREKLIADREDIQKSGDNEAYNLHIQNYPLTIEEAFLNTHSARFDIALLNAQRSRILSSKDHRSQIQRGYLDWELGESDPTVKWRPHPNGPYKILTHPEPEYKNLDIGGIDSYDQDEAGASDSLGSAIIYRRFANTNMSSDYVVAEYTDRPRKKEDFWDGCLKLAVYYNAKMLVEYTKIGILDYFKRMNALKYLKEKPESAHNPGTKTRNRYGVHMNKQVKALLEDLIDDYLRESVEDIWFIDLIDELANYGLQNTDRAMAFGLCLIHNIDNYRIQASEKEAEVKDIGFKYYKMGYNGVPMQIN
tara:strand:+ start:4997 stop:6814 length:1818 start_codon:yes stop_codon:yes gene_type:complete